MRNPLLAGLFILSAFGFSALIAHSQENPVPSADDVVALADETAPAEEEAPAPPEFVWQDFPLDEASTTSATLGLIYGAVESEERQFQAYCFLDDQQARAWVTLTAEIGDLADDESSLVHFLAAANTDFEIEARISRPSEGSDSPPGIEFNLALDHPFWTAVINRAEIIYEIPELPQQTLQLRGSRGPTEGFLAGCQALQDLAAPIPMEAEVTAEVRSGPEIVEAARVITATCGNVGRLRSIESEVPHAIGFTNFTGHTRLVQWIDFDGAAQVISTLRPLESMSVRTYLTHPWMFTDENGTCVEALLPVVGQTDFELTVEGGDQ